MKAYIDKKKCAAQREYCGPFRKCPEKAFTFIEEENGPLGGRMERGQM